jgi:phosphoglycolate phosphatase-like HAD superfamily hydrolase
VTRLLLFDVDMTLLWSGGAGSAAMVRAFHDLFGIEDGFKRIEFSGRTDRFILAEALRQHRIGGDPLEHQARFLERYYAHLPQTLRESKGKLMPGIPALLDGLSGEQAVRLGLATGNFSRGAEFKLAHFGIGGYFCGGGFGEESEDRDVVVRNALERVGEGLPAVEGVVIGDTPRDISSAKANGAVAIGVATGGHSVEQLKESGADFVFQDFSDWRSAVATLTGEA